ncbi:MAG: ATP synthase F1 subunit gamma [Candidatus Omnitrophota bacterium]
MIQSLRTIKTRIRSVDNTRKITRAMEMVSSAKLNRIDNLSYGARGYFLKLSSILKNTLVSNFKISHPFLKKQNTTGNIAVCVITSDTGLAGNFNNRIIKATENFLKNFARDKIKLVCVGKKSFVYFRAKEFNIIHSIIGLYGRFNEEIPKKITSILTNIFLTGEADEVYIIYAHYESKARNMPVIEKFLNLEKGVGEDVNYIVEPGIERFIDELISRYLLAKIRMVILDSFTSEHSTRMIAMKIATDNAVELVENLIILRNKARQAAITKEVLEVASSAEALKNR